MSNEKSLRNELNSLFDSRISFSEETASPEYNTDGLEDEILKMYDLDRDTVGRVRQMDRDVLHTYGRTTTRSALTAMRDNSDIGAIEHRVTINGLDYGIDIVRPTPNKDGKISRENFRAGIGIYERHEIDVDDYEEILKESEEIWATLLS